MLRLAQVVLLSMSAITGWKINTPVGNFMLLWIICAAIVCGLIEAELINRERHEQRKSYGK